MGGKQSIPQAVPEYKPQDTQEYIPQEVQRHKRICPVCGRITLDWVCCAKRTKRLNIDRHLTQKIGDKILTN